MNFAGSTCVKWLGVSAGRAVYLCLLSAPGHSDMAQNGTLWHIW